MPSTPVERPMLNAERLFTGSANRWAVFDEHCGVVTASIGDVSKRIAASTDFSPEEKLNHLEQMRGCARKLAQIFAESRARITAAKEMASQVQKEQRYNQPIDDFNALYRRGTAAGLAAVAHADNTNCSTSPSISRELNDIDGLIKRVTDGDDDDDVHVAPESAPQLTRCPILHCELTNPVKSTECGHVYSTKGAISLLYQENSRGVGSLPETLDAVPEHFTAKCPHAMCMNYISPMILGRDFATELTQRQMQGSARRLSTEAADVELL